MPEKHTSDYDRADEPGMIAELIDNLKDTFENTTPGQRRVGVGLLVLSGFVIGAFGPPVLEAAEGVASGAREVVDFAIDEPLPVGLALAGAGVYALRKERIRESSMPKKLAATAVGVGTLMSACGLAFDGDDSDSVPPTVPGSTSTTVEAPLAIPNPDATVIAEENGYVIEVSGWPQCVDTDPYTVQSGDTMTGFIESTQSAGLLDDIAEDIAPFGDIFVGQTLDVDCT